MNRIALTTIFLAFLAGAASADEFSSCAVRPGKQLSDSELAGMAKISQADAEKAALSAVKTDSATISRSKLEVKKDCLVYSVNVTVPDKSGSEKVIIDAGNGAVLAQKHENMGDEMKDNTNGKDSGQ